MQSQLVTCPSTANLLQQMDSELTVDFGAGESVVNPDEWPNADLKPSKGSVKGQRGGEKMDNLGDLTVKVRTERHGECDISSRVTFQVAKVRKPLLAVSGVLTKATSWFSMVVDPSFCQIGDQVWHLRQRTSQGSRRQTAARETWSVRLANVGT